MSDLAPFVAAVIRDRVVVEQQEEIEKLRKQLELERQRSKTVSITGVGGYPVYVTAQFDANGTLDESSAELWKVEFPKQTSSSTLAEFRDVEIRLGGICKARFGTGMVVEGFVNDVYNNYNATKQCGTVSIWFGGSSGIWLNIDVGPISLEHYAAIRDFDLSSGDNLISTLFQFCDPTTAQVYYGDVSFLISHVNGAMKNWNMRLQQNNNNSQNIQNNTNNNDENTIQRNTNGNNNNNNNIYNDGPHGRRSSLSSSTQISI